MAVSINVYDQAKLDILNSNLNLATDTIKAILLTSSAAFTAANTVYSDISANELATANGYTAGGATMSGQSLTKSTGTSTFDANDVTWTASGGSIAAAFCALYSTTLSNRLILMVDLGGTNTATAGNQFVIQWNASGILTLS